MKNQSPAIPSRQLNVRHDEGATAATYALVMALMVTAAMLFVPGLGARMYAAIANIAGGRIVHWFF